MIEQLRDTASGGANVALVVAFVVDAAARLLAFTISFKS